MVSYRVIPLPITKLKLDKSIMTYLMNVGQPLTCGTYIWYIEGPKEKIIVDTGCSAELQTSSGFPAEQIASPEEALKKVGLSPEDIDTVILTHLHNDHCADAKKYKNARFIVQKKELEEALNPHPAIAFMFDKRYFEGLNFEVADGEFEVVEGVRVIPTPGHSPGGQSVVVDTASGKVVITGFCCIRENFEPPEAIRPIFPIIIPGIHIDIIKLYESFMRIKEVADVIVPIHDSEYLEKESIPD
ncbi:MAG: N-acyl homoserine lactonase family protein [Candidatus Asgardarchaeia archaeon]